jgi:hypothetical protein
VALRAVGVLGGRPPYERRMRRQAAEVERGGAPCVSAGRHILGMWSPEDCPSSSRHPEEPL